MVAILEGHWYPRKNVSLRQLFSPLFAIWTPNGDSAHHYEMFTNAASFGDAIAHAFQNGRARMIYIAAHGSKTGIRGFHDHGISRAKIRHAFRRARKNQPGRGVYFGTCLFVTYANAKFLLDECPRVAWVVGYSGSVDWVESSVIDLFFLRHYLFPEPGKGRKKPTTQLQRLTFAISKVREQLNRLALDTGFHAYIRTAGRGERLRDLFLEGEPLAV